MLQLYIGNHNYSSWSMRPWVMLRQAGIPFETVKVRFDSFEPGSAFKRRLEGVSPTGKVPVLVDTALDGGLAVWDTLAIAEYAAEYAGPASGTALWPADPVLRALGRSACAEMHSGFSALRSACPMNIEAHLPEVGALIWRDRPAVRADVERLSALWRGLLARSGGPMLLGDFSIADAYFAPVCMRFNTYALPLADDIAAYVRRVSELPAVREWCDAARAEADFLAFEEPYRLSR